MKIKTFFGVQKLKLVYVALTFLAFIVYSSRPDNNAKLEVSFKVYQAIENGEFHMEQSLLDIT